jgi:hypothetical protein
VLDVEDLFVHVAVVGLAEGQSVGQSCCIGDGLLKITDLIIVPSLLSIAIIHYTYFQIT